MCRKTPVQRIEREFAAMQDTLTATLKKVKNVCTTSDLWTAHNSFFGMTCHSINEETLRIRSSALACERVKGRHIFDVLATTINEILAQYKRQNTGHSYRQ